MRLGAYDEWTACGDVDNLTDVGCCEAAGCSDERGQACGAICWSERFWDGEEYYLVSLENSVGCCWTWRLAYDCVDCDAWNVTVDGNVYAASSTAGVILGGMRIGGMRIGGMCIAGLRIGGLRTGRAPDSAKNSPDSNLLSGAW